MVTPRELKNFFPLIIFLLSIGLFMVSCSSEKEEARVLVFSKTAGFRHESIPAGIEAIKKLGIKNGFSVDTTENASAFHEENLEKYNAVIFLNTTGDVLNKQQQNDFERFIQAGGGFVGIHAATDTEYDWPWFGKMVGAYFNGHPSNPNVQNGVFHVVDKNHPSTDSLPETWERKDEFYNFKDINPDLKVVVTIDEKSYQGGTNGDNHPMSWYHEFEGGRVFYTNMGHTNETFSEPLFLKHLSGGINYVLGEGDREPLNYQNAKTQRVPDENRFTKVVLAEKLNEPVELALLPEGKVLFVERKGDVKIYDPAKKAITVAGSIPVSTKYTSGKEAEDGLLGVQLDPNFSKNSWIYFFYSPAGNDPKNVLSRFELKEDKLVMESEKVMLEVPTQREECCHTGGSIAFDGKGNLFVSTGDNTNPHASGGYSPSDERPGRGPWDAQKSSANTNDLRGKIIRIHPEADGSYTIPEGNLFPKGTPNTRPEIYTMGHRNPYRISVDPKTGFVYWGDVGPDASKDSVSRGPRGYDEVGQARKAGNFGWPHFIADNKAYHKYDFSANKAGEKFNVEKPINTSPNNTGLKELPSAQKAFIWYPYDASAEFPLVGSGGRTAMAGPVFYKEDFKNAERAFPDYYDGKLFIYEWMRGWIMAVTMDKEGNYVSMERFMPSHRFSNPMDMEFSSNGDLYMLEYGTSWFTGNDDARLIKIEYNGGNRKPFVKVAASKKKGAVPLTVAFSSEGTEDFDRDELKYEWKIESKGAAIKTFNDPAASYTFSEPGVYKASLTVTDAKGEKAQETIEIHAGNEPPVLSLEITKGNETFFFPNKSFDYKVSVTDKEDGSLADGSISSQSVAVTIDYLKEGFDQIEIAQGHRSADASAAVAKGQQLIEGSDCMACHNVEKKSIGPAYKAVAEKYKGNTEAVNMLAKKIINGGSGVWGEVAMSAHPTIKMEDAKEMVNYILNLANEKSVEYLPASGTFKTSIPKGDRAEGVYLLRAAYTDKGANGMPSITSEELAALKSPLVIASSADEFNKVMKFKLNNPPLDLVIANDKSSIGFKNIDLTGVTDLDFTVAAPVERMNAAGGKIEIRIDSPTGQVIGTSDQINPSNASAMAAAQHAKAKLKPTEGKHDLYFVFTGEKAAEGQPVFAVISILFINNATVQ
ncbi:MAG TPA: ThuA domain-containing protein [Cytophagales bacterium]|nr:ThuA domain-containing protein [Cytophagales bacterium]